MSNAIGTQELDKSLICVEVVAALPSRQIIKKLKLRQGATVNDAIEQSGIFAALDGLVIDPKMVGIFGVKVSIEQSLQDGDRVEIYRPLIADPKEVRRQRAERQAKLAD